MDQLDPRTWTDAFCPAPLDGFNREEFQRRVNEIVGRAKDHDILRFVFGAEEEFEKSVVGSTIAMSVEIQQAGRYFTRVKGVKGRPRIRRWICEQWHPPDQFADPFAHVQIPGKDGLFVPRHLLDEQKNGRWEPVYVVSNHEYPEHDEFECEFGNYFCFGEYRRPDTSDLEKLRRVTARKRADGNQADPFAPVSQSKVNLHNKKAEEQAGEDAYAA
jgi:hypothetical protein